MEMALEGGTSFAVARLKNNGCSETREREKKMNSNESDSKKERVCFVQKEGQKGGTVKKNTRYEGGVTAAVGQWQIATCP